MTARTSLYLWIRNKYEDNMIRISDEPYLSHLIFVAGFIDGHIPYGYEIGLCHDLLEDYSIDVVWFENLLAELGYSGQAVKYIATTVKELTTKYTKQAFPILSKKTRRTLEEERLGNISSQAQSVKYGDLIYNMKWTARYEPKKAMKYLRRKRKLIRSLDKGDKGLRRTAGLVVENLLNAKTVNSKRLMP